LKSSHPLGARIGAIGAFCWALSPTPAWAQQRTAAPPSYPAAESADVAAAPAATPGPAAAPAVAPGPAAAPAAAPAWQAGPETLPYRDDRPIPPGYRAVERPRTALVVAGAIIMGVPYAIGLSAVTSSTSRNGAAWLLVPGIGPWLSMGARNNCGSTNDPAADSLGCLGDALAVTGLIFDGILQTAGATLLIVGLAVPKTVLVRQDVATVTLAHVGSGYGLAAQGEF
jgi:hypothetical protein